MKNNKTQNTIKQLSLIDKLVLVSLSLLITSCIFGVLVLGIKFKILYPCLDILSLAGLCIVIGGDIFTEKIIFSMVLIIISVLMQIIALDLYMHTPIRINKIISVINIVIWCCFIFTLLASWFFSRLTFSQSFG